MIKIGRGVFLPSATLFICLFICLLLVTQNAKADKLSDAHRLLRITDVGKQFELTAMSQTLDILRTYSSIVVMTTDINLPESVKQQISYCYFQTYTWDKFEPGFAKIFADNLSQIELRLLIDFFSDRSVPPNQIEQFKNIQAKALRIEQLSIDFMLSHSEGCDEQNVKLILAYLASYNS